MRVDTSESIDMVSGQPASEQRQKYLLNIMRQFSPRSIH